MNFTDTPPSVSTRQISRSASSSSSLPFSPRFEAFPNGPSAEVVRNAEVQILCEYQAVTSFKLPFYLEFELLARQWEAETFFESSPYRMASNPAYKRIIGMGWKAVPFILARMASKSGFWFEALYAITGDQPVPPSHAGDIDAMRRDWLSWGRRNGYSI